MYCIAVRISQYLVLYIIFALFGCLAALKLEVRKGSPDFSDENISRVSLFTFHESWCLGPYGRFLSRLIRTTPSCWCIRYGAFHFNISCFCVEGGEDGDGGEQQTLSLWISLNPLQQLQVFKTNQSPWCVCMLFEKTRSLCACNIAFSSGSSWLNLLCVSLCIFHLSPTNFKPFLRGEDDGLDGEI